MPKTIQNNNIKKRILNKKKEGDNAKPVEKKTDPYLGIKTLFKKGLSDGEPKDLEKFKTEVENIVNRKLTLINNNLKKNTEITKKINSLFFNDEEREEFYEENKENSTKDIAVKENTLEHKLLKKLLNSQKVNELLGDISIDSDSNSSRTFYTNYATPLTLKNAFINSLPKSKRNEGGKLIDKVGLGLEKVINPELEWGRELDVRAKKLLRVYIKKFIGSGTISSIFFDKKTYPGKDGTRTDAFNEFIDHLLEKSSKEEKSIAGLFIDRLSEKLSKEEKSIAGLFIDRLSEKLSKEEKSIAGLNKNSEKLYEYLKQYREKIELYDKIKKEQMENAIEMKNEEPTLFR